MRKIAPAMTPEIWKAWREDVADAIARRVVIIDRVELPNPQRGHDDRIPAEIAMANDLLDDDDPRKITPAMVETIREASRSLGGSDAMMAVADALESYLPPPDEPHHTGAILRMVR